MNATLAIFCCQNFLPEIRASIAAEGWSDVVAVGFPARCGRPPVSWEELQPLVPEGCSQLVVLGRACLAGLGPAGAALPPTRVVTVNQCFHLVAGESLVDSAIAGGAYMITPPWLADWRGKVKAMGFSEEQAGDFFRDIAREVVLLDTGLDAQAERNFEELRATLALPARRLAVGLDQTRLRLARLVLEWRLDQARANAREQNRAHASELADHVAAMDMLARLARTQQESEAIAAIGDLFRMLFAPGGLHYLRIENEVAIPDAPIPPAQLAAMRELRASHALSDDGNGFLLRIGRDDETLGVVAVEQLAFPQYRQRYLNMAMAISGVCGLAIENARNRKRLVEAEKMASLGILVAGVAHEINTPLGVCVAAASTLGRQAQQISERFAARSMTQSDLQQHLGAVLSGTGLLRGNLERIAHLVDSFRQAAVGGAAPETRRTPLRRCIDEVVNSQAERLQNAGVTVGVECDPALEVIGAAQDWASILGNLIGNSLKHAFKGRSQGRIDITVIDDGRRLRIDYRDNGGGMSPATVARIFDPFYTTDMQQGMGLGMHLVYNLVTQRMGGSIQCESGPQGGAHFRIELPRGGDHG